MRTTILCILFVALCCRCLQGQNLVPNPSFEIYSQCPFDVNQVHFATGWTSYRETPEYFNSCNGGNFSVPCNARGCQYAATGEGYCSLGNFSISVNFREYIGIELTSPLVIGQQYYLTVKANLSDYYGNSCATDKIGLKLSTIAYDSLNPAPIGNLAHIYSNSIISDSINWTVIHGTIIADSAYSFICIGNFFDNSNIDTLNCGGANYIFNYYIDDVCVAIDSIDCLNFNSVDNHFNELKFEIFPNPIAEYLFIDLGDHGQSKYEFYDVNSHMIYSGYIFNDLYLNTKDIKAGIYFIRISSDLTNVIQKIIKL